jgi:FlaG/FlaF family flagellin (archaellin)
MKNYRRNMKGVSTVLATLLMIAVAVAAALVTYAWVMGYLGGTTGKVGRAIQIQSVAAETSGDPRDLLIYVQNVGQGAVTVSDIYVEGIQVTPSPASAVIPETETQLFTVTDYLHLIQGQAQTLHLTVRVVCEDGTFMENQVNIDLPAA